MFIYFERHSLKMKRFQGKCDGKFCLAFITHLANSTGIKVILSVVLTAVTWHGSNDDSDDKKFWKPSPFAHLTSSPGCQVSRIPERNLVDKTDFQVGVFLQGTATANKRPLT